MSRSETGVFWYVFGGWRSLDGAPVFWERIEVRVQGERLDGVGGVLGILVGPEDLSGSRCDTGSVGFGVGIFGGLESGRGLGMGQGCPGVVGLVLGPRMGFCRFRKV